MTQVRLSQAERELYEKAAKAKGMKFSTWMREALENAAKT